MNSGSSDLVRAVAIEKYIQPAVTVGENQIRIAVRDLMQDLTPKGFPRGNYHQICTSLRKQKFLKEHSLEIEAVEGPPKGSGPTVVYHFRISTGVRAAETLPKTDTSADSTARESSTERVMRLAEGLRGLLKDELAEYGGGEAFIRWIRSEPEEDEVRAGIETGRAS
jgi:hypothetical protein